MAVPSTVLAQGNVFNPYGNSGYADYREFGRPVETDFAATPIMPRQAVNDYEPIIGRPRANSFQEYTNELNGVESDPRAPRGRAARGVPYFQAYQQLNSRYNRVYRPNDTLENRKFEERRRLREDAYAKAMTERDPGQEGAVAPAG